MKKLVVIGSAGRMGEAILRLVKEEKEQAHFEIAGKIDKEDGKDQLNTVITSCDVLIEFAHPAATEETVRLAVAHGKPLVIGTTGHDAVQRGEIARAAERIPIVFSPNYSIGVNVLFHLVERAAHLLDEEFDIEILEAHHRFKKDAPSGTAQKLLELLLQAKAEKKGKQEKQRKQPVIQHGRAGEQCQRMLADVVTEIGIHSVRAGDIVGEHTVFFGALGERIELTHKASNRDIFARGALKAAEWIIHQKPGLYNMTHVLGLQ